MDSAETRRRSTKSPFYGQIETIADLSRRSMVPGYQLWSCDYSDTIQHDAP